MPGLEQDNLRETSAEHHDIPLAWKLGACAALVLAAIALAALLILPLSCMLNDWPQPVCRMFQAVMPQAAKGEKPVPVTTNPNSTERSAP